MNITCGLFIIDSQKNLLVVHPTPVFNYSKKYSIPKGLLENNELELDCAIRETFEETNINISNFKNHIFHVGKIKYKNTNKILSGFAVIISDLYKDSYELKCNSKFYTDDNIEHLEVDEIKWISIETILNNNLIHYTQLELLNKIYKNL